MIGHLGWRAGREGGGINYQPWKLNFFSHIFSLVILSLSKKAKIAPPYNTRHAQEFEEGEMVPAFVLGIFYLGCRNQKLLWIYHMRTDMTGNSSCSVASKDTTSNTKGNPPSLYFPTISFLSRPKNTGTFSQWSHHRDDPLTFGIVMTSSTTNCYYV